MKFEMNLVFCVLVLLPVSSQTRAQSRNLPPTFTTATFLSHAGTSASPDPREDPGNGLPQRKENPASSTEATTVLQTEETVHPETWTDAGLKTHSFTPRSAPATSPRTHAPINTTFALGTPSLPDNLSSTQTVLDAAHQETSATDLISDSFATFPSQPVHTVHNASSTAPTSTTQLLSESPSAATTHSSQTSAPGRAPVAPTHQEVPSELNVGDQDLKGSHHRSSSPLDPLLAGLLSVFIVTTAIVFIILFLKFRQRTNHPEFHRLQDLPMDDLMEDTPLSRYTY
ncbi:uncharacterized protein PAE49_015827 [Odontesthes bonariensis]|uniref:uncharacterized protein LOC142399333 n=1 Tax=Odontesthes bonariensis TaxID=219752 RepID=UPI003F5879A1